MAAGFAQERNSSKAALRLLSVRPKGFPFGHPIRGTGRLKLAMGAPVLLLTSANPRFALLRFLNATPWTLQRKDPYVTPAIIVKTRYSAMSRLARRGFRLVLHVKIQEIA